MNMAGFYDESISNGTGWRAVLFVSGCPHGCPGCHNKAAQNYNYGEKFNKEEIINRIKDNSILKGITISGGEPLCKENMPEVGKSYIMETDSLGNCKWVDGKAGWQGAEHSLMRFPENEIEIGDTWVQMVEDAAGSAPPFYNRYRLNGRDRKNPDLIIFSSEIYSGHPDLRESRNLGKSSFTFNLADKWIQDSDVRIKHEYMFPVPQRPDILLRGKTVLNVDMERIL